jgi:hypothetical protein
LFAGQTMGSVNLWKVKIIAPHRDLIAGRRIDGNIHHVAVVRSADKIVGTLRQIPMESRRGTLLLSRNQGEGKGGEGFGGFRRAPCVVAVRSPDV